MIGRLADARRRTTSCSRSGRASASSPRTSPTASRSSTPSSSTGRSSRPLRAALAGGRTSGSSSATRSGSTSPALEPRADEARREPPLQRRDADRRRDASTGLPAVAAWCVMVQREVADRFFAEPSTKAYGAVSVLVQLARASHRLPPGRRAPSSGRPRTSTRRSSPSSASSRRPSIAGHPARRRGGVRASPEDARRTPLALAGVATRERGGRGARRARPRPADPGGGARAGGVRRARGRPSDEPADDRHRPAPAKINLALVVGPTRAGRQARGRDRPAARSTSPIASRSRPPTGVDVDGLRRTTRSSRRALDGARASGTGEARSPPTIDKRDPGRGGARRRQLRRRDRAPRSRTSCSATPLAPAALHALAARLGADVPFFLADGAAARPGDGSALEPLDLPQDYVVLLALPARRGEDVDGATVYAAFDERAGAAWLRRAARASLEALARRASASARSGAAAPERPRLLAARRPPAERLGAFRADVSGAGPGRLRPLRRHREAAKAAAATPTEEVSPHVDHGAALVPLSA